MLRVNGMGRRLSRAGVALALIGGVILQEAGATPSEARSLAELQTELQKQPLELDTFRARGPFEVTERRDHEIRLSARERIKSNVYLAAPPDKAPLVILLHGHDSSKEAHARQAEHLASWGMHSVALQLSRTGPWDTNGRRLARIINLIYRNPAIIDQRVDARRIILSGHSFGAYAVTVAMAQGAPAAGGILLDAAMFGRSSPEFMRKITKPMMLLAADEILSPVRYRDHFYYYLRDVAEISVKDATHEDAQYPSETAVQQGTDPDVTEALQITFSSALTAAAFSLSANGTFDYAWAGFGEAIKAGRLVDPKKK